MNQDNNSEFTIIPNDNNSDLNVPVGNNSNIPETPGIESLTPPAPEVPNVPVEERATPEVPIQEVKQEEIKNEDSNTVQEKSGEEEHPVYHIDGGTMHGTIINDEELIKEYIGKNAKKIMTRKFNFAGFFFSSLYMFYRKMIGWGIIFCILNVIVSSINMYASILVFLLSGFCVNKLYLKRVNKKIDKIKMTNPGVKVGTLMFVCERNGGTSFASAILGLILQVVILIVVSIAFMTFGIANSIFKNLNINFKFDLKETIENARLENVKIPEGDSIYDGHTPLVVDIKVDDVFTYEIPTEFTMYNHSNGFTYNYSNEAGGTLCSIDLRPPIGYSNSESMIKQMRDYHMPDAPLSQIEVNGLTWTTFEESTIGTKYYYGTMVNNQAWKLEYIIYDQENIYICNIYKEQFLNSIKVK